MKFTLSWLKDHLDTNADLDTILDTLTAVGLEVEGIENPAELYKPFFVAHVESAEQHPDADRLRVCKVNTGKEIVQVVCGAPNARSGMKGVFAPEGSYVPGTDITLKKGVIRGQESCGMLVSEREMNLSDDHDGIIEVNESIEIGTPFSELYGLDDPVIEIALTPNRGDCAGVRGIARDLAAAGLGTLKPLDTDKVAGGFDSPISVDLKFNDANNEPCPLFVGRYVKNVKNGPSPDWLQKRLKAIGLRPISALVDITNYVSYDLCRPLHVFDADKLSGNLHIRLSENGESFKALDEKEYKLSDTMTAVCDDSGVVALGGIMGGLESGCTDETTNVFLEVAYFDPLRTAKAGRAAQITSDARYRFERGVDPAFLEDAAEIATRMIVEFCGGEVSHVVVAGKTPEHAKTVDYNPHDLERLTGISLPVSEQKDILARLGFEAGGSDDKLSINVPSWRPDIMGAADIVEEVIRIHGFDKIETESLPRRRVVTEPAETDEQSRARMARLALANRGLNECVTWSFMDSELAEKFGSNDNQQAAALKIVNPISSELGQMRPSILANLIEAASRNHDRGYSDAALYEVGPIYLSGKPEGHVITAAGIRFGNSFDRHWTEDSHVRPVDAFDAKADAMAVLEACGAPSSNAQVTRDAPDFYHPGRSGVLRLGKNVIARFGEIHPALLEEMGIKQKVTGFEVFLGNLPTAKKKGTAKPKLELSSFQPVARDFAFIVDKKTEANDLIRAIKGTDKKFIQDVSVFDVYEGKNVEEGKKSIALNVILQPVDKTLTEEDLEAISSKIIENVASKTGGSLRS